MPRAKRKKAGPAPLLTRQEEQRLGRLAAKGDQQARNELALRHQPLVRKIARIVKTETGTSVQIDDLVNEGNVGLLRAIDGFDPSNPVRLGAYAWKWIHGEILLFVRRDRSLVVQTHEQPDVTTGTSPEDQAIEDQENRHARAIVTEAMQSLDKRERVIVEKRLMADPEDVQTYERLGRRFGRNESRMRQLESQATEKLAQRIEQSDQPKPSFIRAMFARTRARLTEQEANAQRAATTRKAGRA